ncbi:unnamed protein product [Trichogramma brassicae]|uniref:Nitrogen permease regulator 2-like protein n=1 Tax=Trichogramma brassicae TaxID=86971 RepID=A0A6H5IGA6_9HYME|nr:unnamed protein product [Trichogramma brassicae]
MTKENMSFPVTKVEDTGQEGPIRCIFFSEFHPTAGPKITCQVPDNYISKDIFDNVSVYIIPKAQLQRSTITVTLKDYKILGFPIKIDNKKYARNAFYFNLCFVCDAEARTVHYEPVVKKMSDFLMALEVENCFLSASKNKTRLLEMLYQVMNDLNMHKMCTLTARQPAFLRDIYRMYASMTHGNSIRDLCQRLNPQTLRINERKLIQFGLIEGLIRRVHKYPILLPDNHSEEERNNPLYKYFTGSYSLDEICCTTGQSSAQIEDMVERDPSVVMLWK